MLRASNTPMLVDRLSTVIALADRAQRWLRIRQAAVAIMFALIVVLGITLLIHQTQVKG